MTKQEYIEGQICKRCLQKYSCEELNIRCHKYHGMERDWEACQKEMIERAHKAHCSLCQAHVTDKECYCYEIDIIRKAMEDES